jgi:hypothetical protein
MIFFEGKIVGFLEKAYLKSFHCENALAFQLNV